ncbi:leucine-rich repeat domain-containing protein, partial [Enterococcus faecium]
MNYKKIVSLISVAILTFQGTYLPVNAEIIKTEESQPNETLSSQTEIEKGREEATVESTETFIEASNENKNSFFSLEDEKVTDSSSLVEDTRNTTASPETTKEDVVPYAAEDIVEIPDPVLFEALKNVTERPFADKLTKADLEKITKLDISDNKGITGALVKEQIYDLTGLEYATNLSEISINNQKNLQNINTLRNLPNLTTIYAQSTSISDLSAVEDMPALSLLSLSGTPIADFSPILNATNLEEFTYDSYNYFDPNNYQMTVEDFNKLVTLNNLKRLNVPNNKINDISALKGNTTLRTLNLSNNAVKNLTPLTEMHDLETIYLDSNNLSSLDELSGFTTNNISILYADDNHITDLHNLRGLYEGMQKVGDHRGLQINNQTITLPTVTAKVGESAISNNPTIDINGQKMPISGISDNGLASSDNQTVVFNDLPEGNHTVTYRATYSTTSSNGVLLNYSIKVTQPIVITPADAEDKSSVTVHDSTIYVGDEWKAEDNFDVANAADGTSLDYASFISAGGVVDDSQLDTNTPGTYPVTYTLNGATSIANITV